MILFYFFCAKNAKKADPLSYVTSLIKYLFCSMKQFLKSQHFIQGGTTKILL